MLTTKLMRLLTVAGSEWVMVLLILLSIISIAIVVERIVFFRRRRAYLDRLDQRLTPLINSEDVAGMKDLERGFGASSYRVYSSTGNMLEKVSSGEHLLGYNVLGSYALVRAKKDQNLGVVLPKDYTLVLSRVMFIGKHARNPDAAKLWLDYILSARGQKMIGSDVELFSVRNDVDAEYTAAKLNKELGSNVKPIPLSAEIVSYLDPKKRLEFLNAWKAALAAGAK